MRAEIISVGTELLLGDIVNTNAQFLAQELAALGYTVYYQTVVGDNPIRLRSTVLTAKERSDVLIFTGGLGPTDDDLTKETVAAAFGDTLVLDEEELESLHRFFLSHGREMTDNNAKQAFVPKNGRKLPNPNGTAPGAFFRQGDKYAFLLPGPPLEMQPMFAEQVRPVLEAMQDSCIRSLTLRTVGIGESDLENRIHDLLEGANPTAALYAKTGEVHIRITAKAATPAQAEVMCEETAELFRTALGDLIYSANGDDLETTVVKLLLENDETLATAESCTGGLLSERITSVPGASGVFGFGACTYANEFKHGVLGVPGRTLRRHGAVSSQTAAAMAFGAAKKGDADYGVATTGIAGPDGGTPEKPVGLVYVAASSGRHVYVKKLQIGGRSREYVRRIATQHALDMVRRLAAGLPVPGAKHFTAGQEADYDRVTRPRKRGEGAVRGVISTLAVLLVLSTLFTGIYLLQSMFRTSAGREGYPTAEGLVYGTAEYTAAAMRLVQEKRQENPAIDGLVALPGGRVEELVQRATTSQSALAGQTDGTGALLGADATPTQGSTNTLVMGGASFAPLAAYQVPEDGQSLSTFTYFTERDARVYHIFAVILLDEADGDGFDPAVLRLPDYESFLDFALGMKARSLYNLPVALGEGDTFMTLAAANPSLPGRTVYLCGRLARPGEQAAAPAAVAANGRPLMPEAWYAEGEQRPSESSLYSYWLRWYLAGEVTNSGLQLAAGMPAQDVVPTIPPEPEPETPPDAASESEEDEDAPASESAAGESESAPDADESASEAASSSAASSSAASSAPQAPPPQRTDPATLTVTLNGEVVTQSTLDILAQICQAEAADLGDETIMAVAVAAHSWILNQQGGGNAAPAVAGAPPSEAVRVAVAQVATQVLSGDGETPAFTPWHAMAATGTNPAADLFGSARAYLPSVSTPQDQSRDDWRQFVTLPRAEVEQLLTARMGVDAAALGAPEAWFNDMQKNEGGYITAVTIGGVRVEGLAFWQQVLVQNGAPALQSPAFEAAFDGENFVFTVYGRGHGCGMSLAAAAAMAREGAGYEAILARFYPGASIINWT